MSADRIGVVGCGKVGFAFLAWLSERYEQVLGYDPDPGAQNRIAAELGESRVAQDLAQLGSCRSIHICVPTEPTASGAADLSIITAVVTEIGLIATGGLEFVSQRSTCPPGTADQLALLLPNSVSYGVNPSFLRKASIAQDTEQPERIALGGSDAYVDYMLALYESQSAPVFRTRSRTTVELLKYVENTADSLLISFWNELLEYAMSVGVSSDDFAYLLNRVGDRAKFASLTRVPGHAFGMWCLPKDLSALLAEMQIRGLTGTMLEATRTVNDHVARTYGTGGKSSVDLLAVKDGQMRLTEEGHRQVGDVFRARRTASE